MFELYKIIGNPAGYEDLDVFHKLAKQFLPFAQKRFGFDKPVDINLLSDPKNAKNPLGKTAYYDPQNMKITIFVDKRHVKDILRSLGHELVHHTQNCRGEFDGGVETGPGYAQEDGHMREMEREAYERGQLVLRDFEDKLKKENKNMAEVKNKKLADRNKDGKLSSWETTVAKNIERNIDGDDEKTVDEAKKCPHCDPKPGEKKAPKSKCICGVDEGKKEKCEKCGKPLGEVHCNEGQVNEEETVEEGYSPEQRKKLAALEKKYPNRDKDSKQADEYAKEHKKIIPSETREKKMDENWTKGNKDQLLFERLVEKWCK